MTHGSQCEWSDDTIERYSMRNLPDDEAAAFEEHLLVCEECQSRLKEAETFAESMRLAALQLCQTPSPNAAKRLAPRLFPVLAYAAVLAVLMVAGWRWMRPSQMAPALAVRLEAIRGAQAGSQAPAGRPLVFQPDLHGLPPASSYALVLLDRDGRKIWQGSTIDPTHPGLSAGQYFLRVYSNSGELLREYGLEIAKE